MKFLVTAFSLYSGALLCGWAVLGPYHIKVSDAFYLYSSSQLLNSILKQLLQKSISWPAYEQSPFTIQNKNLTNHENTTVKNQSNLILSWITSSNSFGHNQKLSLIQTKLRMMNNCKCLDLYIETFKKISYTGDYNSNIFCGLFASTTIGWLIG